ncbi:hypothetical protein ACMFMG_005816 [Clarireedia jacksonii]
MPQTVMENENWECPKCLKICSCGKCRKDPKQKPYAPKGTLLGHDTKKVADYRSVESLVDFSKTNLGWLRPEHEDNPEETARMKRLREKAEQQKAFEHLIDTSYLEEGHDQSFLNQESFFDNIADIDPQLLGGAHTSSPSRNGNHQNEEYPLETSISFGNQYQPYGSIDAYHDFDNNYPTQLEVLAEAAEYPSGLLEPVAPIVSGGNPYPEASHDGQTRMMGVGYYQQPVDEMDEMDNILYDSPKSDDESNERPIINSAELLAPLAQFANVAKKRKRLNSEGIPENDEDDVEFVASKRQKRSSKSKLPMEVQSDVIPPSEPRLPRRSVGQLKSYTEPPIEIILSSEDEVTPANPTNQNSRCGSADREVDDVELATKALSYLTKEKITEDGTTITPASSGKRRGRPRGSVKTNVATSSAPPTLIVKHRRSAWLARKEEAEAEAEKGYHSEVSRPVRRTRYSNGLSERPMPDRQSINTSSDAKTRDDDAAGGENQDEDRGRRIRKRRTPQSIALTDSEEAQTYSESLEPQDDESMNNVADEINEGSMFRGDIHGDDEQNEVDNTKSKLSQASVQTQTTRVTTDSQSVDQVVVKRRRGRPRKKASSPPPVPVTRKEVRLRTPPTSKSPPPPSTSSINAAHPKKFLSLREKLALKGKKVNIVASKTSSSFRPSSAAPSARETSYTPAASVSLSITLSPARETNGRRTTQSSKTACEVSPNQSVPSITTPELGQSAHEASDPNLISPNSDAPYSTPATTTTFRRPSFHYQGPKETSGKAFHTIVCLDNKREELPVKKAPTIVRLMESEESDNKDEEAVSGVDVEVVSNIDEESDSEGWSPSDSDIPAMKPALKVAIPEMRPTSVGSSVAATPRRRGRPPLRR